MRATATRKDILVAMVKLARPNIVPGGVLAYALGVSMGYFVRGALDWAAILVGAAATGAANLMAHYVNECADVDTDSLTRRSWFSGGSGVLPSGVVPAAWALRMGVVLALLAVALETWGVVAGYLPPATAWILGLGMLGGWFYSMPPLALERRGLGELDNALIGGFLMPLMGYAVLAGAPTLQAFVALIPIFCIVMVGLISVHWADREADAAVGKRTLTARLGPWARLLYVAIAVATYALAIGLNGSVYPLIVTVSILATLPVAVWACLAFLLRGSILPGSLLMGVVIFAAAVGWALAG